MPSPANSRKASSLVYRLSGLPVDHSIEDIRLLLERALKVSEEESGLEITSLAVDHYQAARQVATLTFLNIPSALSSTSEANQWPIDLSGEDCDPGIGADHPLIIDTHFHGLTPLNAPKATDEVTDCLVVCGLGGHAFGSFKEKSGPYMWLRDSLPKDLQNLRVLLYGYDSGLDGSYSNQNVSIIADTLANHIKELGIRCQSVLRPLVIVAHSLGGLVTKQAIIKLSRGGHSDKARVRSIAGLLFFGVPNRGMDIQSLQTIVGDRPNRYLLESVGRSSDFLLEQSVHFPLAFPFKDSPIFSFFETQASPTAVKVNGSWKMAGPRTLLVDRFSATYPRPWDSESFHEGLNRTHSDLVKFSPGDIDYRRVLSVLRDIASQAAALILSRFQCQESADELSLDEQACLRSLSFTGMHARESNIEPAAEDAGNWLLENVDFQDWAQRKRLDRHHGFFWIKGNPGSGKSTLIKKVYATIKASSCDPSSIVTAFFFNARGSDLEKSPVGMFRTLLHSLCRQVSALRAIVLRTFLEKSRLLQPGWEWTESEIMALLNSVVKLSILGQRKLVLFLDALDECDFNEIKSVIRFFEDLASSAVRQGTKVNICLSSRYWPQFKVQYCFQVRVELANQRDIESYVHNTMGLPLPQEDDPVDLIAFRKQILEKASGIFLWVVLVVQDLLGARDNGATLSELRKIVRKVPSDLRGVYLRQLQNTSIHDRLPLLRLFQCVFFSQRPLSATELRCALAFSTEKFASYEEWLQSDDYVENDTQMEKRICELSRGLIEVKPLPNRIRKPGPGMRTQPSTTVQFIHESVRDFLQADGFEFLHQPSCQNQTADGHDSMKRVCLNFLKIKEFEFVQSMPDPRYESETFRHQPTLLKDHPLLEYMVDHLFTHVAHAEQHGIQQDEFKTLISSNFHGYFERWRNLYDLVHKELGDNIAFPGFATMPNQQGALARPLHILSQHGLLTEDIAKRENNTNIPGGLYQYAIHAAAANGNIDTVEILLNTGADPEAVDAEGRTAFHWAAFREDLPILTRLKDKLSLMELEMRLRIMSFRKRLSYEIVSLLVPESVIPPSALMSVCSVARYADPWVFSFILDKCDTSIIHEELLRRICIGASCYGEERKLVTLLNKLEKVKITPSILRALPFDQWSDAEQVIPLLFEKSEGEVDDELLKSLCQFRFSAQLISKLKAAGNDIPPLTSQHILSVLKYGSAESVAFFVPHMDETFHVDALLRAAASNKHYGVEVMRLLLGWLPTYRIGDDLVMAAVRNRSQFPGLLTTFMDRQDDLVFPAAALTIAVENYYTNIVGLVYERCELSAVTEDLLISATFNREHRDAVVQFLLERNSSPNVSQRVLEEVVRYCDPRVVGLVLDRCNSLTTTEDLLLRASQNWHSSAEIFEILLERDPTHVVSESVMVAAVANFYYGADIMNMLHRRGKPLLFSEAVVAAAIKSGRGSEPLKIILQHNKYAAISSSTIMKAMQGRYGDELISLMLRHDPSISITEEHLMAAATNEYCGNKIFVALQNRGKIHKPTLPAESTKTDAAKHRKWKWLSSNRSRGVNPHITKNVIKAAAKNEIPIQARSILALFEGWGFLREADRKRYYGIIEERERMREEEEWRKGEM